MRRRTFDLPEELDEALDEEAEDQYTSKASIVRRAIAKEVKP
jgi:predicted transcriptional regulator